MKIVITESQNDRIIKLMKQLGNDYTDSEGRILKTDIEVEYLPERELYMIYPIFYVKSRKEFPYNFYKHVLAQRLEDVFGVSVHTASARVKVI